MDQPIASFHQDELGDWVARLACGHHQHVRHDPPWTNRPWVTAAEGRASKLGMALACRKCDQGAPPDAPPALSGPAAPAVEIRRMRAGETAAVFELLAANGWRGRLGSVERLAALVDASQLAEVAVIDGRVVGFLRGLTDGLSNGYLSMVVVESGHRRLGIGRRLVAHATGSDPQVTWVLRAGRQGAEEFFAKLGFERSSLAMERRRS